mgnify:CR=1 FL=1
MRCECSSAEAHDAAIRLRVGCQEGHVEDVGSTATTGLLWTYDGAQRTARKR